MRTELKHHLWALGTVLILSTLMSLFYTINWYESRTRYIEETKQKVRNRIETLESERAALERAEADEEKLLLIGEEIRKEEETLAGYERTLTNSWSGSLPCALIYWWPWVLLTPGILALCRRFPFKEGSLFEPAAIHLIGGLVFGTLKTVIERFAMLWTFDSDSVILGAGSISLSGATYGVFVAFYNGIAYYRRYRERQYAAGQLEKQLAQAQLQVLRMQLNPHFLFNTLHAVSTLMARDIKAADRMITRLSDLLRHTLSHVKSQEVPLGRELEILRCYLDIEQTRFGDRLAVDEEVPRETLDALVPSLILQPIVENAVNHGISRIASEGRIRLRTARQDGMLLIEVRDNGPGLSDQMKTDTHVGLDNTRARLARLYGDEGRIDLVSPDGGGLLVRLSIPFHTDPLPDTVSQRGQGP